MQPNVEQIGTNMSRSETTLGEETAFLMISVVTRLLAGNKKARAVGSFEMSLVKGLFAQVLTDARKSRGSNYQLLETDREAHRARAVTFGHVSHDNLLGWRLL